MTAEKDFDKVQYSGGVMSTTDTNKKNSLERQIENLLAAISKGNYSEAIFEKLAELEKEKAQISKRLEIRSSLPLTKQAYLKATETFISRGFNLKKLSPHDRGIVAKAFIERIVVGKEEVDIEMKGDFASVFETSLFVTEKESADELRRQTPSNLKTFDVFPGPSFLHKLFLESQNEEKTEHIKVGAGERT